MLRQDYRRFGWIRRGGLLVAGLAGLCATTSALAQGADGRAFDQAFIEVIAKTEPSVVAIFAIRGSDSGNPDSPDFIPRQFGAGIIFAPAGQPGKRLILTNYHVVRGGAVVGRDADSNTLRLLAQFPRRRNCDLKILAADPRSDLAVLEIDFAALGVGPSKLRPIEFGDATGIRKGQTVLALGNPYAIARDGSASASGGRISNISRRPAPASKEPLVGEWITDELIHSSGTLLVVDTRLDLGTSGGPLVDLGGRLIGITTSLAALEGYEKSVGFAVPVNTGVRRMIEALALGLEVEYGFLGVLLTDVPADELAREAQGRLSNQVTAARAKNVLKDSPAESAGLVNKDIVLSINDVAIHDDADVIREIAMLGVGTTARLRIWRPGAQSELILTAKLGKWPVRNIQDIIATRHRFPLWRGVRVDHSTGRQQYNPGSRSYKAVVVTHVEPDSAAAKMGLAPGDFVTHVDRQMVQTPEEFDKATRQRPPGNVTLTLLSGKSVLLSP